MYAAWYSHPRGLPKFTESGIKREIHLGAKKNVFFTRHFHKLYEEILHLQYLPLRQSFPKKQTENIMAKPKVIVI